MQDEVTIALVGIGGYGELYAAELFVSAAKNGAKLVAGIDPYAERSLVFGEFQQRNILIYPDLEQFYEREFADLVIVSTPIHLHAPHTHRALEQGSNVLCEKPVSGTIQEGLSMLKAERETGKFIAVGYQWSFSPAILELKKDIQTGLLGQPRFLKAKVFWPRADVYYGRNQWTGRQKIADRWVLDSPVNNATSHYLNNAFFILGSGLGTRTNPISVQAELYRAREIENYDTAALRCMTEDGVEILFFTTHSTQETIGPVIEYQFDNAIVTFKLNSDTGFVAHFMNGHVKEYGNPDCKEDNWRKIWESVDAIRSGRAVACGVADSLAQTICMNGVQESVKNIATFPKDLIQNITQDKNKYRCVDGLGEVFERCFDLGVLPAELTDIPWARAGTIVDLHGYNYFPSLGN